MARDGKLRVGVGGEVLAGRLLEEDRGQAGNVGLEADQSGAGGANKVSRGAVGRLQDSPDSSDGCCAVAIAESDVEQAGVGIDGTGQRIGRRATQFSQGVVVADGDVEDEGKPGVGEDQKSIVEWQRRRVGAAGWSKARLGQQGYW